MPSILIISFVEWSGAFQRPQQMALGFARAGWDVTYVAPFYLHRRRKQVGSGVAMPRRLRIPRSLALPGARKLPWIESLNQAVMRRAIRKAGRGEPWDAVIFNDPRFGSLAASLSAAHCIFDHMDDLSAYMPNPARARDIESSALRIADRVWTGTASLADRDAALHESVRFIPCGVDGERFARPDPKGIETTRSELRSIFRDQDQGERARPPLAGYFGVLNERIDPRLIRAILDEGWRVLLIGPDSSRRPDLPSHPRLHWIGPRPYAMLPFYLACMDLALIPYDVAGPHRFLYPVKALEYLAGGKPVLSSPLPDVARFLKDFVLIEDSPEDWAAVARDWNERKADAQSKALKGRAYALERDWNKMIEEMSEELVSLGAPAPPRNEGNEPMREPRDS